MLFTTGQPHPRRLRARHRAAVLLVALALTSARVGAEIARVVRTADELLGAMGPDRAIVLEPGTYRISRAQGAGSPCVSFEEVYDGREVVVSGMQNLTLRGTEGVTILAEPRYAYVLTFRDTTGLRLENLTLGHTVAGECAGGVLRLENCSDVQIVDCELYGSGTVGADVTDSYQVSLATTEIRECTNAAVRVSQSSEITLSGCVLRDNQAYPLLSFERSWSVGVRSSTITGNSGYALVGIDGSSGGIEMSDCDVSENDVELFADGEGAPDLADNRWEGNAFTVPGPGSPDEWRYQVHAETNLGFQFPGDWRVEKSDETLGVMAPDEETAVILAPFYDLKEGDDLRSDPGGVLGNAFSYLQESARSTGDMMEAEETEPLVWLAEDLPSQTLRGPMTMSGEECRYVLRLVGVEDKVYAMLAIFRHGSEQSRGETVGTIVGSLGWAGR